MKIPNQSNTREYTKENVTLIICLTIIISITLLMMGYFFATSNPAIVIFRMEMDDNTLQAVKAVQIEKGSLWDTLNETEKECNIKNTSKEIEDGYLKIR